jgi:hypothetical protein
MMPVTYCLGGRDEFNAANFVRSFVTALNKRHEIGTATIVFLTVESGKTWLGGQTFTDVSTRVANGALHFAN